MLAELCRTAPPTVIARALKRQAAVPHNQKVLSDHAVLMQTIVDIARQPESSPLAREDACYAIQNLMAWPPNRAKLLALHPRHLLDAVCLNLCSSPPAATVAVYLAEEKDHRIRMVQHERLLKALIRCAGQQNHPSKHELKGIVVQLVESL